MTGWEPELAMVRKQIKNENAKRRIRQNAYGNWYGYIGTRRVEQFFNSPEETMEQQANRWLKDGKL
jgi:hypothetical protein